MARRPRSASTTLETALTIPVNIHVCRDHEVATEAGGLEVVELDRQTEALDARAADGARRAAAPDHDWGEEGVDLVHQPLVEERRVDLAAPFHQQAQDAPAAKLFQQRGELDAPLRGGGELHRLGFADVSLAC